jgi:hypothetical protein
VFRSISCLAVGFVLLLGRVAAAQPGSGRIEVWGGLTLVATNVDTRVVTRYTPAIDSYSPPLAGSTAGQTVQVVGANATGVGGGVNLFFSRHAGFQFLVESEAIDLTGVNGDYTVLLNYTARQPPDYVDRTYSSSSRFTPCGMTEAWGCVPPTTGSLRETTLGFNAVGRWPAGRRVNVELSGGLSYYDLRGDAEALRYTVYRMGGHSTLFSEQYRLAYSVGPAHAFGANLGATLDVELGGGVCLMADARYFTAAAIAAPVTVTEVTNRDTIVFLQEPATIQGNLHPPDVEISPARLRALVGIKIRR